MNKFYNKFTTVTDYYKLLFRLLSLIFKIRFSHIILFTFVFIFSSIFEISLLGFLYILLKVFLDPNFYLNNFILIFFIDLFNIEKNSDLIIYLSSFFIITCLIAGAVRLFFLYLLFRVVENLGNRISNVCYQKVLFDDYINLYSKNTNDTLSIFQKMPIINNSIYVTLLMFYNIINFVFIFSILLFISFEITIYASLAFIIFYLLIVLLFKNRIFLNASTISNEQITNIKIIRETFNGFRDILINNYQKFYKKLFYNSYAKLIRGNEENRFLYSAPRPILDTFLLTIIGLILVFNSMSYSNLEKLIPILVVIAVASQRILPILNQLYAGHMGNVDATPHLNFIFEYIKSNKIRQNKGNDNLLKFKKNIILSNISFSYKNNDKLILKDVDLKIKFGSRIGIIGKSGSGKSTLIDLILGILNPTSGKILVDGKKILDKKNSWFKNISSVPQNIFITEQTIAENIAFSESLKKIDFKKLKKSAKMANISEFIENKKNKYLSVIGEKGMELSAGQRQRLAIARALYKKSKLIIFDEATNALDINNENKILETIYSLDRKKFTLIIISHKMNNLKNCDHIYKIHNSKIYKIK